MTYVLDIKTNLGKNLLTYCCNELICQSIKLKFLQIELFIDNLSTKFPKTHQKWFGYYIVVLKKWRLETSLYLWIRNRVEQNMPPSLIMSDNCLTIFTKNGNTLTNSNFLINFLKLWYSIDKHCTKILTCLDNITLSTFLDQKATLKQHKSLTKSSL